ncbi:hypothetical protein SPRG_00023 [Saprolegnia parasitica CBS 223.65]|uniref:Uncharacterized protein n=1 Tax=Saprolegnia parasitica (strain CBS 223.65) TaxID=695850 RepID=A0A067D867_SAPPC|nr:hypothetical protein SPRG_00023 [Saprolegnia parasitica CBS 223.65]KDO35177.1 hypothetical protein SPRG_00023 [Saprolegnia parasitica CBS 223.65]|eukprot:XP_012193529.1 hypothetical protein SPRG_00023 [Saprolegnia parasitica CBS 223.65]
MVVSRLLVVCALLFAVIATPAPPTACHNTAYQGGAAQFCGNWLSSGATQPCCCPAGADRCSAKRDACDCKPETKKKLSTGVYVAIAAGVLVVVGGGVFCLFKRRRRLQKVSEPAKMEKTEPPAYQPAYADTYARAGGLV